MRVVIVVLMMLAAWPAQAQVGGNRRSPAEEKRGPAKPVVDEKAYKAALERIPEPKEKYDPWSGARPAPPERKPR